VDVIKNGYKLRLLQGKVIFQDKMVEYFLVIILALLLKKRDPTRLWEMCKESKQWPSPILNIHLPMPSECH
jgi:hypothetical protein